MRPSARAACISPGRRRTDRASRVRDDTGWLNVWVDDRPLVDEPFEHAGPSWGMGQRSYAVSPDGRRVAFTRNESGFGRLCVVDVRTRDVTEIGRGVHGQLTWVGDRLAAIRTGARTPTQIVVYDTSNTTAGTWERRVLAVGPVVGWDAVELPEPEVITVDHDGTTLHARRYIAGAGRTLCWIHGGPTDQWQVEFLPRVAYWWSQGWDVLVPDPRGTTGHGRAYQQALRGEWGRLDVDDTAAIVAASHERGWSVPERTVLMGGSSGGHDGARRARAARRPRGGRRGPVSGHRSRRRRSAQPSLRGALHAVARRSARRRRARTASGHRSRSPTASRYHFSCSTATPIPSCRSNRACGSSSASVSGGATGQGQVEFHVMEGEGHGFRAVENKLAEYRLIGDFVSRWR